MRIPFLLINYQHALVTYKGISTTAGKHSVFEHGPGNHEFPFLHIGGNDDMAGTRRRNQSVPDEDS